MGNTHLQPDSTAELNSIHADLLAPAVLSATWSVPVPPSMTLAAFEVYAYVLAGTPARLTYVYQDPVTLALAGGDGTYWVAIHADTYTPVAGWTRRVGSHYVWHTAATQPANPPGALVALKVIVAGGVITAIDGTLAYPATQLAVGGARGQLTFSPALRWDGSILHIEGQLYPQRIYVAETAGDNWHAFSTGLNAGTNRYAFIGAGTAPSYLGGPLTVVGLTSLQAGAHISVGVGLGGAPVAGYALYVHGGHTSLIANVGINLGSNPIMATLDVNGSIRARGALGGDAGANITGTITTNYLTATHNIKGWYFGAQGDPDSRFAMRCYGTAYFDGLVGIGRVPAYNFEVSGNAYITGVIGVGATPNGSWSVAANSILAYGAMQAGSFYCVGNGTVAGNFNTNRIDGTLIVASQGFSTAAGSSFGPATTGNLTTGLIGAGYAPVGSYWIRAGTSWFDEVMIGGGRDGIHGFRNYGNSYMDGNLRVASNLAVGGVDPGYEGYTLHCAGNVKFRATLHVDGVAQKPGGGPWADSNSMVRYKKNVRPLLGALTQLLRLQGKEWEWDDAYPELERTLPGTRTGFVVEDIAQVRPGWVIPGPRDQQDGKALAIHGFEALTVEALREIVIRLEALERTP